MNREQIEQLRAGLHLRVDELLDHFLGALLGDAGASAAGPSKPLTMDHFEVTLTYRPEPEVQWEESAPPE